jgi:hypothetical protein
MMRWRSPCSSDEGKEHGNQTSDYPSRHGSNAQGLRRNALVVSTDEELQARRASDACGDESAVNQGDG